MNTHSSNLGVTIRFDVGLPLTPALSLGVRANWLQQLDHLGSGQTIFRLVWLVLFCLLATPASAAETGRIHFLQLRFKDGNVSLVSATNVPGTLKTRRAPAPERAYRLAVEDAQGVEVWSEPLTDPCVRRFEYEDPAAPGVIRAKDVQLAEAEITIRVPGGAGQRQLAVYRRETGPDKTAAKASSQLVTRIPLPQESKP